MLCGAHVVSLRLDSQTVVCCLIVVVGITYT
jgi:hypothetical protein